MSDDLVKELEIRAEKELDDALERKWWTLQKPAPTISGMPSAKAAATIRSLQEQLKTAREDNDRMDLALREIMDACGDGSIGDDVVWFSEIETLFDKCATAIGQRMPQDEYEAILAGKRAAAIRSLKANGESE